MGQRTLDLVLNVFTCIHGDCHEIYQPAGAAEIGIFLHVHRDLVAFSNVFCWIVAAAEFSRVYWFVFHALLNDLNVVICTSSVGAHVEN